jgi:hypothetical protein
VASYFSAFPTSMTVPLDQSPGFAHHYSSYFIRSKDYFNSRTQSRGTQIHKSQNSLLLIFPKWKRLRCRATQAVVPWSKTKLAGAIEISLCVASGMGWVRFPGLPYLLTNLNNWIIWIIILLSTEFRGCLISSSGDSCLHIKNLLREVD